MKVGILTFHLAYNYGAILQAYALQKKIAELGIESEIIDYIRAERAKEIRIFAIDKRIGIKGNIIKIIKDIYRVRKNYKFNRFMIEEMRISEEHYETIEAMADMDKKSIYDIYIVGSDQVWGPLNNQRNPVFLLSFVEDSNKKCSYAASFGSCELDEEMYQMYSCELSKFRVITVREESALEQFDFLLRLGAKTVLDPTLLLTEKYYQKIQNVPITRKKYVFLYTIMKPNKLRKYAKKICKENNYILIDSKKTLRFFLNSGPKDFLSFVANAEYVFTNSFHGTAFSIIYHKKFVTEVDNGISYNNRSMDLMKKLGLSNRDMNDDLFDIATSINYEKIDRELDKLRIESLLELKRILKTD